MFAKLKIPLIILILILAGIWGYPHFTKLINKNTKGQKSDFKGGIMKILSPVFKNKEDIPIKYTCDGENINPPLILDSVPISTQSLILIVDDPDAPAGTWVHWTLWNIDPKTQKIEEKSVPENAIEGKTSSGKSGYSGPCPPFGTHHYFFKLYALDTKLDLKTAAKAEDLEKAMEGHILEQAEIIGLYTRK